MLKMLRLSNSYLALLGVSNPFTGTWSSEVLQPDGCSHIELHLAFIANRTKRSDKKARQEDTHVSDGMLPILRVRIASQCMCVSILLSLFFLSPLAEVIKDSIGIRSLDFQSL